MDKKSLGLTRLDLAVEQRGLRDHVYDSVLQLLLGGSVDPGARLSIDVLARDLGVSPTPVREALVQLERTGLVSREARKGYRVAPPLEPTELSQLFDARIMLEVTAARLATPAHHEMLVALKLAQEEHRLSGQKVIEALDSGVNSVELATNYFAKDSDFHRIILRYSENQYIFEMSESLGAQLHRLRQSVHRGITDVREAIFEHEAIVEAFANNSDLEAPEHAMRYHLEQVHRRSVQEDIVS